MPIKPLTQRYAVGLYRVSTAEQGQSGLGLGAQQASVRAFAAAQGWALVAEFSDVASGKDDHRPVNGGRIPGQRGGVKAGQLRRGALLCKGPRSGPFARHRHRSRSAGDDLAGFGIDAFVFGLVLLRPGGGRQAGGWWIGAAGSCRRSWSGC